MSSKQGACQGNSSKYDITIKNKTLKVDFDTPTGIKEAVNFIHPNRSMLNLFFMSSISNSQIYLDHNYINETTDIHGNAYITGLYPELGKHEIELKKGNVTNAKTIIDNEKASTFKCLGKEKLKCSPI